MKKLLIMVVAAVIPALIESRICKRPSCELSVTSEWKDLDEQEKAKKFGGRWVHVATLTIKKRSKDLVKLSELDLKWHGKKIPHLAGSLYRKSNTGELVPVEENLISDGTWNSKQQILQLKFEDKQYLQPTNSFCLVLTVPQELEPALKHGYFDLLPHSLPTQLKPVTKQHLKISMLENNKLKRKNRLTKQA